jgi:hypothetical protein
LCRYTAEVMCLLPGDDAVMAEAGTPPTDRADPADPTDPADPPTVTAMGEEGSEPTDPPAEPPTEPAGPVPVAVPMAEFLTLAGCGGDALKNWRTTVAGADTRLLLS